MKQYKFQASPSFQVLVTLFGIEGISDLDVGEECSEHDIFYKHLEAWYYDDELGELEVFAED